MGFYIRKYIKVGPFRFNLSKSGVGVSAGVKGLRLGTGPRGNYVHLGRYGLYYRATIPSSSATQITPRPNGIPRIEIPRNIPEPEIPPGTHEPLQEIESADISQMVDSSSTELLKELNHKRGQDSLLACCCEYRDRYAHTLRVCWIKRRDYCRPYRCGGHWSLLRLSTGSPRQNSGNLLRLRPRNGKSLFRPSS